MQAVTSESACAGLPAACLEPHASADGLAHRVPVVADGLDHPLALPEAGGGLLVADSGRGVIDRLAGR
jgi:hypothetical protein